jgi:hypothetical protein
MVAANPTGDEGLNERLTIVRGHDVALHRNLSDGEHRRRHPFVRRGPGTSSHAVAFDERAHDDAGTGGELPEPLGHFFAGDVTVAQRYKLTDLKAKFETGFSHFIGSRVETRRFQALWVNQFHLSQPHRCDWRRPSL